MFNCAGILRMGRFEDIALEECDAQIAVNIRGVIIGTRAALPYLRARRGQARRQHVERIGRIRHARSWRCILQPSLRSAD